jgi:sirohydrochlorin cobaltochelatase
VRKDFHDAALLLVGHGSTKNSDSQLPVFQQTAALRERRLFAEVREGFWQQEPKAVEVLSQLTQLRVFITPLFISDGYFSENIVPQALGFSGPLINPQDRVRKQGQQVIFYCRPVGSHESMTSVLLARASEVVENFPFPRKPKAGDITLFIVGHGTPKDEASRKAVQKQVEQIRQKQLYAAVEPLFLEEEPRIQTCYQTAQTRNIVVVPFFISEGLHVQQDIPVMLGEPERIVKQRLQAGQAHWRNPTEKHGKLVWLSSSIGTEIRLADVILERVEEATHWTKD